MKINTLLHCLIVSLLLSSILGISLIAAPIHAEATDANISEEDVKDKIKERLEEVVDKGLATVKGVMEEEKKSKLYAWVGTVESSSEEKISIEAADGLKEAKVASNAAIFKLIPGKSKKSIDAEDIEKGQFAIVMGPKEEEVILAKRIITLDEAPIPVKREIISGKVKEVDESKAGFISSRSDSGWFDRTSTPRVIGFFSVSKHNSTLSDF